MKLSLCILPNWLGDLVMSLPALKELQIQHRCIYVGGRPSLKLLESSGFRGEFVQYDRHGHDQGLSSYLSLIRCIRKFNPDMAVAFPPSLRAASLLCFSGASDRRSLSGNFPGFLLSRQVDSNRERHLADSWLSLVSDTAKKAVPELEPGSECMLQWQSVRESLDLAINTNYAVFSPGASYGPTKRWLRSRWVELAKKVQQDFGLQVLFSGSSQAEEKILCEGIARECNGLSTAGKVDLSVLSAMLKNAKLFVGNDSGPMHLAAAVGTPTLGLFFSTSPAWTAPRGVRCKAIHGKLPACSPCFNKQCPTQFECIQALEVDAVIDAIHALQVTS